MFDEAVRVAQTADVMVVVGSSLAVYPAASLVRYTRPEVPVYLVDPYLPAGHGIRNLKEYIPKRGAEGVPELVKRLIEEYK
jgi:NAD-dependent deacetylase